MGVSSVSFSLFSSAQQSLQPSTMKLNLYLLLVITSILSFGSAATQRPVCAICVDRRNVRRRQEMLRRNRPTYYTRPNAFTGMTFQEFAARYTGGGLLPG